MSLDVLTAIWRDPPCKGGDLLCLLAIADNADESGYAWPSVQTIARKAAMTERGAQKCLAKLVEAGLLRVEIGGGRGKSNAYQITTNGIGVEEEHKNPEQYSPNSVHPLAPQNPEQRDINPEQNDVNPEPQFTRTIEPSGTVRDKRSIDDLFLEFWHAFPHRNGVMQKRKQCRLKFGAAVKRGVDPLRIIAAAKSYRGDKQVREGFGRGPEPWLNQEGWDDEAAQPSATGGRDPEEVMQAQVSAIKSGREYMTRDIPASTARALIEQNLVTPEECRRAGVTI